MKGESFYDNGHDPPLYQHNISIVLKSTNSQTKGGIVLTPIYNTSDEDLTTTDFDAYNGTLPGTTCDGMISQSEVVGVNNDEVNRTWYKVIRFLGHEDGHIYVTVLPMYKEFYKPSSDPAVQSGVATTLTLYDHLYDFVDQVIRIL